MTLFDVQEATTMQQPPFPMPEIEERTSATGASLAESTVFLRVKFGSLGNSRKISNSAVQVDADKDLIRVSKKLLESREFDAIRSLDGEIRQYIYNTCLPGFDDGIYFIPLQSVPMIERKLREFKAKRAELVNVFCLAYPRLCQEAQDRLRSVYNPRDYMDVEEVRARFTLSWLYLKLGAPGELNGIDSALFQESKAAIDETIRDAKEEVRQLLRATALEVVEHLRERLTDDANGNPKIFRDTAVTKLQAFCDGFSPRDINNDRELRAQVAKIRELISGVQPDALRDINTLRAKVRDGLGEIKTELDKMVIDKPIRKFRVSPE